MAREAVTCGHPDRPHRALGKCLPCYFTYWRKVTSERKARRAARLTMGEGI